MRCGELEEALDLMEEEDLLGRVALAHLRPDRHEGRQRGEKEGLIAEFDETRRQLEEDVDREIEELKEKYEAKLSTEREAALRLKGENGIMRKKFTALQKDIEDQKDTIQGLYENKKSLHEHIASL